MLAPSPRRGTGCGQAESRPACPSTTGAAHPAVRALHCLPGRHTSLYAHMTWKLWNVKKYVFQVGDSVAGVRGSPRRGTACRASGGRVAGRRAAWARSRLSPPYCSVTLPVSAGGCVRHTLNIQRADCGRGGSRGGCGVHAGTRGRGLCGALGLWAWGWVVRLWGCHFLTP